MSNFKGWTSEQLQALAQQMGGKKAKSIAPKKRAPTTHNKPNTETANGITQNIVRAINMRPGCAAYRINNVGVYDKEKGVYRKGATQKGIFDISATMRGKSVWIEVKAGKDKPSRDQLIFQQEIRLAGGIAEFVRSTDEGIELIKKTLEI